ncbi:MAG: peptide deformylase [Alphaproteobacteria bacterium]|nr:peptide deformylase [Alphaproteobacteria bacterium]
MAILEIIVAPDPRLKVTAKPVAKVDARIASLMADMLETMYAAPGIGLAGPQVGEALRVIVVDVGKDGDRKPIKMANPEIVWASEERVPYEEGCLSLPEHFADVTRPKEVKVRYLDENDAMQELHATELLAVCVQHEMDHLEGVLFVDHLSTLRRGMIIKKLRKYKKTKAAERDAQKSA